MLFKLKSIIVQSSKPKKMSKKEKARKMAEKILTENSSEDGDSDSEESVKKSKKKEKKKDDSDEDENTGSDQESDDEEEEKQKSKAKTLTHKEKKALEKKKKFEAEMDRITKKGGEGHSALDANFTVAQAIKTGAALTQVST